MSVEVDLLTGVALLLDATAVGVWSPDTPTAAGDIAITVVNLPQEPELVICLTDYPVANDPGITESVIGLQVRCRGNTDPRTSMNMRAAVFDQLHGYRGQLGSGANTVEVSQIFWQSSAPLGPDGSNRFERVDNYYVQLDRAHQFADD